MAEIGVLRLMDQKVLHVCMNGDTPSNGRFLYFEYMHSVDFCSRYIELKDTCISSSGRPARAPSVHACIHSLIHTYMYLSRTFTG